MFVLSILIAIGLGAVFLLLIYYIVRDAAERRILTRMLRQRTAERLGTLDALETEQSSEEMPAEVNMEMPADVKGYVRQKFHYLNKKGKQVIEEVGMESGSVSLTYRMNESTFAVSDIINLMWRVFETLPEIKYLIVNLQSLKEANDEEKALLLDIYGKVWAPFYSARAPREILSLRGSELRIKRWKGMLPQRESRCIGVDAIEPYEAGRHPEDAPLLEFIKRTHIPQYEGMVRHLVKKTGCSAELATGASPMTLEQVDDGTPGTYANRIMHINKELTQLVRKKVEELEKMNRLKKYMSPQVVENLLHGEAPRTIGHGTRKLLTIVFVDVRRFTASADQLEPEDIFVLLNGYLTEMTRIVYKHGGIIDKFVGDGIMIFFGAPTPCNDHAGRAVAMALEMQAKVPDLAACWNKFDLTLNIGIGINTGVAQVGNVGSDDHMNYTAIGHSVNLAARLVDRAEPGQIVISQNTYEEVKDQFIIEPLGEAYLKGIVTSQTIHNVLAANPQPLIATELLTHPDDTLHSVYEMN